MTPYVMIGSVNAGRSPAWSGWFGLETGDVIKMVDGRSRFIIRGDTLILLDTLVPETYIAALPGRTLSELVDDAVFQTRSYSGTRVIDGVWHIGTGTVVRCEDNIFCPTLTTVLLRRLSVNMLETSRDD